MPMSNDPFYDMVEAVMLKCIEVMRTKGTEYTEGSDNKLENFEAESLETNVPVLDIIHIFANKHQKAINNFRKTGRVESEALEMRFVDRINYLFLELAECIALGYLPRETWLIEAVGIEGPATNAGETGALLVSEVKELIDEEQEPCCGHPGNEQCCEKEGLPHPASQIVPPSTPPKQERKARRRPDRPRTPQQDKREDEDIPIATPDRRFDRAVIAERAEAKRQRDE